MADNYIEKRMEDLRSGRLGKPSAPSSHSIGKNILKIPFPTRRVLVTGGVNGIGLAIVEAFLKAGCRVAVFDIDETKGRQLAEKIGIRFYHLDLADAAATEQAFKDLLKAWLDIDIIISNAGVGRFRPIEEMTVADFKDILDINLLPAFNIARLLALHRRNLPIANTFGGRFIIISSTRHLQSEPGTEAYSASKGGLASLTHSLMMSLSPFAITVNSISPGWINVNDEQLSEADNLQHPSRRVGTPEDVARLCIFLSAPGNDFINGIDIPIDGGMTHRMIYV